MKVAIYCRLSTEDRDKLSSNDDSESIQNQKAILLDFAAYNCWKVYDIYIDDDYSGANHNRPEFNRLIQDAKSRKFDMVLCKSQSRFTRELEMVEKYINGLFPRLGIRFVGLVDNADTDNRGNKKTRQINGLANEWFLEDLSENIKAVLTNRREQGYHIGSFAPYGYQKDPDNKGHLIIDPEAAEVVRDIFTLFDLGYGKQAICRILNERDIPNPTEYKRLHGMMRSKQNEFSPLWRYSTISNILMNEVYIGNMIQGRSGVLSLKTQRKVAYPKEQWIIVKGTHEPVIDQDLWDRVQALIDKKATPPPTQSEGLFARRVRCMHCGSRLHSTKNGTKRGLKCERHALHPEACPGTYISVRKLERIVAAELTILSQNLLDMESLEQGIDPFPDLREMKHRIETQIAMLHRKITADHTVIRSAYTDKVNGTITESEYMEFMVKISYEKNSYEKQISELNEQVEQINEALQIHSDHKRLIQQYTATRSLAQEMVTILIDHIDVGRRDPITKVTPVDIHWNF